MSVEGGPRRRTVVRRTRRGRGGRGRKTGWIGLRGSNLVRRMARMQRSEEVAIVPRRTWLKIQWSDLVMVQKILRGLEGLEG